MAFAILGTKIGIKKGIDKNIGVDKNLIFHVAHPGRIGIGLLLYRLFAKTV